MAGNSELAEAVKVLARGHQDLVWSRQRFVNRLRNTLREFYPAALEAFKDLDSGEALAVLERAPTPAEGRQLSRAKIIAARRRGGRQRNLKERAIQIQAALRAEQLQAPATVGRAYGLVAHRQARQWRRRAWLYWTSPVVVTYRDPGEAIPH